MSISQNYESSVDIKRLEASEDNDTESYETHIENVACHIQPLDDSYGQDVDGSYGKDWVMFCDTADILEGDRVVDGSTQYVVVGIEKFNFQDTNKHMEVRIRKMLK